MYDLVQHEFRKRKNAKGYKTGGSPFSGKIVCGECGSFYGSKVWHSTSKYRRTIWQCNHKFKNDEKCDTPHIYEEALKQAFIKVFNGLVENKAEIISNYNSIMETLIDTTFLDKECAKLQSETLVVTELLRKCVEENANASLGQTKYNERYSVLMERYETAKKNLGKIADKKTEITIKRDAIIEFMKMINGDLITEFDEELWHSTIERLIVKSEHDVTVEFKDGLQVNWII